MPPYTLPRPALLQTLRIGFLYLCFSIVWILGSDTLLFQWVSESRFQWLGQIAKGLLFVSFSAIIVGLLARRELLQTWELRRHFLRSLDLQSVMDRSGRFLHVNERWSEVLGLRIDTLLGTSVLDLVGPEDRATVAQALAEGREVRQWRVRLRHADGSDRWLEVSAYPEGARIYHTARDVTEVVQAQQRAQALEERYERLFRYTPLPMWVFDRETLAFLAVNDAAVGRYGYTREEFLQMTIADIRPPEDTPRLQAAVAASPRRGFDAVGLWQHRTRSGETLQVEITAHYIDFQGRDASVVVAHDVTARREIEAQLLHAQRMESVGRLAGGVAHDFNNLLMVIGSLAALAAEDLPPDSPTQKLLAELIAAQERGAELTRQLLTFSRKAPLQTQHLDLSAALRGLDQLLRRLLGSAVRLEMVTPPEPLPVSLALVSLEQVVMNLAVNARDAMPSGGCLALHLAASPEDREAILTVRDTGEGIPAEIVDHIFEPFFTTKPAEYGTGLGLSTAYGIVTAAGGTINVASVPAQGTTFTLRFPMLPQDQDAA